MKEINQTSQKNVGIIGAGNIGLAIAKGLVNHGGYSHSQIWLSRKRLRLLDDYKKEGFGVGESLELVRHCDVLVLAVLPSQARELLTSLLSALKDQDKILVSVVSAVSLNELESWTENALPVVRVMPNTASEFGAGMTCISGHDEAAIETVKELFDSLGLSMVIKEQLMPAATILAACGIAFFLRYIRAVSQGGIQIGFHAGEAGLIAAQTARGAAELLMQTGNHPEEEIDRVTTPMGCTIAGLNEMEHHGLSSSMIRGIVKSYSGISDLK
ncbi:MAG: pyrroline-5-carboxylate reductase [Bacteroidetes bacterium]|nr:MAG: pyrroline-5-carboxylate reductase [Bacteroidota bacterium]